MKNFLIFTYDEDKSRIWIRRAQVSGQGVNFGLGGIRLEHEMGLLGHSDADVLIHAICDALLGAANMRDIGYHFPDNSADFKNIDSKILLAKTVKLIAEKGYRVGNVGCHGVCRTSEIEKV